MNMVPWETKEEFSWILLIANLPSWSITFFQEDMPFYLITRKKGENELTFWHIMLTNYVIGKMWGFFHTSENIFNYKTVLTFCNAGNITSLFSAYQ